MDSGWYERDSQERTTEAEAKLADLPKCPKCGTGINSLAAGGTPTCFHCGSCGYIDCASDTEMELMKLRDVARLVLDPTATDVPARLVEAARKALGRE